MKKFKKSNFSTMKIIAQFYGKKEGLLGKRNEVFGIFGVSKKKVKKVRKGEIRFWWEFENPNSFFFKIIHFIGWNVKYNWWKIIGKLTDSKNNFSFWKLKNPFSFEVSKNRIGFNNLFDWNFSLKSILSWILYYNWIQQSFLIIYSNYSLLFKKYVSDDKIIFWILHFVFETSLLKKKQTEKKFQFVKKCYIKHFV